MRLVIGIGWRPETAWLVAQRARGFTEVIAESVDPPPAALLAAQVPVIVHGVALSLGSPERPERARVARLARLATQLRAPLVSEHVAFRPAGAAHFVPVPHTRAQLAILVDNVQRVMDALPVPLALENVAAPLVWPGDELAEADFLAQLLARTGAQLLLDVSNLHANLVNHGGDLDRYLDRLPLDRVAYMHVAGGARVATMWRDTHAHPITPAITDTLARVLARTGPRPLLLERDAHFGTRAELETELATLEAVLAAAPGTLPMPVAPPPLALPRVDRVLRASVASHHARLFTGGDFDPVHLAETHAILDRKQRLRAR